ncbi:MAG: hypothetical protein AMXMBFR84_21290 [Candidatus Hydrogenedentota bacterium]
MSQDTTQTAASMPRQGTRISQWDRIERSVFVALAVGLAWGIRGDFGHLIGAMYPGVILAFAFGYVTGQTAMYRWMPVLAIVTGLGIGAGGHMSYGVLHGYGKSDTFINYAYGFFTLFLQGGAWGVFGCAAAGLLLEHKRTTRIEWVESAIAVLAGGTFLYILVVKLCGFHINPWRSNASIAYTGGAWALLVWLWARGKQTGFRSAILGYTGFGMGMSIGRMVDNINTNLITWSWKFADGTQLGPFNINTWNTMEVSVGLIAGFVYTYGMLGQRFPEPPSGPAFARIANLGALYAMAAVPILHAVTRTPFSEKITEWTSALEEMGYGNAGALGQKTANGIIALCVAATIGSILWSIVNGKDARRWPWFPVVWLSLTMVLYQNANALYFFRPPVPNYINMHTVFWILFILMTVHVIAQLFKDGPSPYPPENAEQLKPFKAYKWVLASAISYVVLLVAAGFVNGKETMKSANTRFPIWAWPEGPFPGVQPKVPPSGNE